MPFEAVDTLVSTPLQRESSLSKYLVEAARTNDTSLLEKLLAQGLDPDTPVDHMQVNRNGLFVSDLLWTDTTLKVTAAVGNVEVVYLLLSYGACVDKRTSDWRSHTALQAAAENGHDAMVQMLLEYNADINATTGSDWTALTLAACYNSRNTIGTWS